MDISPDPVSLRAAALSTLKSKRRKPAPDKGPAMAPSRPTPVSDFQLDYGQDDVMVIDSQPPLPPPRHTSPKITQKPPIIDRDVQMREEGEISDEEILRPAIIPLKPSPPPNEPSEIATPDTIKPELDGTLSLLGPEQVRPGLLLTMDEYDTAKDIILDLLGWGVPPDFLVDCGLTKELVFYVFNELNLRLPDNFDSSGIIPYTPESLAQAQQSPPEDNPTIVDTTAQITPTVTTPPLRPPSISSWDSPSNTDLHDMERQRRQELLARKAVQASRKLKQSASIEVPPSISQSDSSSSDKQDVRVAGAISTEIIEDFLNSTISPLSRAQSHGSVASATSIVSQLSEANLAIDPRSQPSPPRELSRRGVRPVASDFVDFDSVPRGTESKSHLESPALSSGIIRRLNLTANFRDIGSRRCVIDLSDSEDDDEQEIKDQLQQSQSVVEDQLWVKRDRRSKASNYHPPAFIKSSLSGNQSPAALMMKELEIRRMRELIAKREEETRLKKLASTKSTVNIDTSGSSTPVNQLPSLKQEDVDIVMHHPDGQNGFSNRNPESATPPPRTPNDEDANDDPLKRDSRPYQDLASEAQEAQVISTRNQEQEQQKEQRSTLSQGMVDADPEPSPSTQVNQTMKLATPRQDANELVSEASAAFNNNNSQDDNENYGVYNSIFESYPLLRGSSDPDFYSSSHSMYPSTRTLSSSSVLAEPSSYFLSASSSSSLPKLNLRALKLAAIAKVIHPFKQICRYEVPGNGTCRDEGCDDVHLSRLQAVEPSDQDVAQYLFSTLPREWLTHHQVSVSKIVAVLQELGDRSSLQDRVDQALLALGSRPT